MKEKRKSLLCKFSIRVTGEEEEKRSWCWRSI